MSKGARSIVEAVCARESFDLGLKQLAKDSDFTETQLRTRVRDCLGEFVAIPSNRFKEFAGRISKAMVSLGYESPAICDPRQLEALRELMTEHPVALLWTHKSHVDGTAVIATMHEHGFPMLHSFGGINMAFAGVGYSGRRSGIIYIRRSFADDLCYKFALQQYLAYLLEQRAPFSWAFEGTRSRVGKLMPPRLGLLKYLTEAAAATGTDGLRLVPVSVSYDLISDVDDYAVEESGARKQAESIGWFFSYLKRLRSPMGKIYLNFGEPVCVDAENLDAENDLYKLAFRVAVNANKVTPITLPGLVCLTLLGSLPKALSAAQLSDRVMALVGWARERNIPLTSSYDLRDSEQLNSVMEMMIRRGLLTRFDRGLETVYGLGEKQHSVAGYYRNTAIHFFVNKAIAELALMRVAASRKKDKLAVVREEALWIRSLLKHEFYFSPTETFEDEIHSELDAIDPAWQATVSGGSEADILRMLVLGGPLVAHATLLDLLDAYLIMAQLLERGGSPVTGEHGDSEGSPKSGDDASQQSAPEKRDKTAWVAMGLQYGSQAYLQRLINSDASIGRQPLANAYRWLEAEGLAPPVPANATQLRQLRKRLEGVVRRAELLPSLHGMRSINSR